MIHAFKQIRLTNTMMSGVNGRLMIGLESDAHMSDLTGASGILAANTAATGALLYSLINAASAGVSNINGSSGAIGITGAGNITVTSNGQVITISGNTGAYANFATNSNLGTTGQNLYGYITSLSGQSSSSYATISNLASTGQQVWNTANSNSLNLSGNLQSTGSTLLNLLKTFSGNSQSFSTGINPTGFDSYMVTYPLGAFSVLPRIQCTVEISGNVMYAINITGRSTTNFYALFSDTVSENGVVLHTYATINQ